MDMDLSTMMSEELAIFGVQSCEKWGAIRELAALLMQKNYIKSMEHFIDAVREREKMVSTGIGDGIAIPHAISPAVLTPAIVFGRSLKGVEYDSIDNQPVFMLFLFAIPATGVEKDYLRTLAALARLLVHENVKKNLMAAKNFKDVRKTLQENSVR